MVSLINPSYLPYLPSTSKENPSPVVDLVHKAAMQVFKILAKPVLITGYLLLQLAQPVVSGLIGALSHDKSISKTFTFGRTFFLRNLASEVGFNKNGGAPYTSRSKVSEGLHVGRLPFKKDVNKIASELKIGTPESLTKDAFIKEIKKSTISNSIKEKILKQLQGQKDTIIGLVIDITEPKESTYVLGNGSPATREDWNKKGIVYLNFPSEDMKALDIQLNLDLAELAQISRENNAGALIHCAKGVGRSLTIGLTTLALFGDSLQKNPSCAPSVTKAIETIKSRRAYGLDAKQEYAVHKSKMEYVLKELKKESKQVTEDTIKKVEALLEGNPSGIQDFINNMPGDSLDHANLKTTLRELNEAMRLAKRNTY